MTQDIPLFLENISFRYRDREEPTIMDISFELHKGEILLIAGSSGSGKTTLIRVINGLIPRSYKGERSGKIEVFGQDPSTLSLAHISQKIGTVLQDPERQILGSKVLNEVAFGLENLSLSRDEILERVDTALARLKISHLRDRDTFSLSGGEKQKVALAGVVAMRPGILLLDEPLASLDPASAQETLELVRGLADEGLAVGLIEHRIEDVLKFSPDRALYLEDGRIRYLGKIAGLTEEVNYHEIKLPAPMVMEKAAAADPLPPFTPLPSVEPASVKSTLVEFQQVKFWYEEDVPILNGIDFKINRGDVIAILGANGAGKTTFIKHALGLLKPRAGLVLVQGKDTKDISVAENAATIGYVFQSPSHMLFAPTVREELEFGPTNIRHPKDQIEKEVHEAISIVNLSEHLDDPPFSLSFGQQKRVSIAAILAMHSKVLVLDEPTAGQDYANYTKFMDSIVQLPGFEAILFITHDVDLALIYANRIVLFEHGNILVDEKPETAMQDIDRLKRCRLVPTSLLDLNLKALSQTGHFMRLDSLAKAIH